MKTGILLFVLAVLITDPALIGKINRAKEEAKKAYLAGDYETAVSKYKFLTDSLQVSEDEVLLNLANAYYHLNDTANALGNYQSLTQSSKNTIRSTAQQQLGVIKNKQQKFEEALAHFKEAIKSDPNNEDARYNYELLKRKLDEEKKQEQKQKDDKNKEQNKDQDKDQQNKDNEKKEQDKKDQEKKDQEQKKDPNKPDQQKEDQQKEQQDKKEDKPKDQKENQPSSEKLEQMKISEEKAKMILEAMKNQEIQYLQQNKRKATQPKQKDKPDW